MKLRTMGLVVACSANLACWEFVEPDLAAENGAAVLQATLQIDDRGQFTVSGLLAPGLDAEGFRREVTNDTLYVFGRAIGPASVQRNGSLTYSAAGSIGRTGLADTFTFQAPAVEGLADVPSFRWYTPRRADPDTVRFAGNADIVLNLAEVSSTITPAQFEQWSLGLQGREQFYTISANGRAPRQLRVPSYWIPAVTDSVLRISLTTLQSTQRLSGNYRVVLSYAAFTTWTVILR
jgi:hypothetical protein